MLILLIIVKFKIGSPVFFKQMRPGLLGAPFLMIKIRTMSEARGGDDLPLPDELRLSAFGKFLRSTSLDELPELFNVLKGDMSLVGPRPLLVDYLPLYSEEQFRRHEVKPGITGWAQVNGRNAINWEEKFSLDIWYVDNNNFLLDMKILLLTVHKVLKRDGVSAAGEVTMPAFKGSSLQDSGGEIRK
jgi:lipopolysaccharide/colanic/teichoic acid biosynthesis glycosyltransferase